MKKYLPIFLSIAFLVILLLTVVVANRVGHVDSDPTIYDRKAQAVRLKMADAAKKSEEDTGIKIEEPFASFGGAMGYTRSSSKSGWVVMKNTIAEFDNLDSLKFGCRNFEGVKYLYFNKLSSYLYTSLNAKKGMIEERKAPFNFVYVVDYDDYRDQIEHIADADNVITLSIIERSSSRTNLRVEEIYMTNKAPLESNDKLVIKFRIDKKQNTVRFLSYCTDGQKVIYSQSFLEREHYYTYSQQMDRVLIPLVGTSPLQEIIQSDALYENFYYEAPADKFLEFIRSPLMQE